MTGIVRQVSAHERGRMMRRALATAALAALLLLLGAAPARAADPGPAFPRIAVWWPNNDTQSAAARARCDWIVLQAHDGGHIAELRAANPVIKILGSTNARELSYVLGNYADPHNVELRGTSTDWILTQVGSTLSADVGTATTSIPVADASRFAVGEMALIDHELMYIEAIRGSVLTVRARGPVNPPAPHAAGARIASVVTAWPGQITFDLSTNCPRADVGWGPETWGEWNARRGRAAADTAAWDGLFIDALETDPTWMVRLKRVRSIDPFRHNTAVEDDYQAFDAAWTAGAVAYGDVLRSVLGDRPIVGNGNVRNYRFNGTVFEDYPYSDLAPSTWSMVFVGPFAAPHASYREWIANAFGPPLTLVQTYGSASNYRAMRFGLCSTLMNDGYFSYAINGTLHAAGGLDWFDEYDDCGLGRGYLGRPVGAMFRVGSAWRRDYDGGVVLVNPSASAVTVKLNGTFRKIRGRQAPTVNSGATVSSVTIPSRDGIVLLRIPSVTLAASATAIPLGSETTLQALVSRIPVGQVRFEQRTAGTSVWKSAATRVLDGSGAARLVRAPRSNTEYRVVVLGANAISRTVKVGVRPAMSIRVSAVSVKRRSRVTLSGSVSSVGSTRVTLQRLIRGAWRTVATLRVSGGRFRTSVYLATPGAFWYRVHVAPSTTHLAAASAFVRIAVR